MKKFLLALPLAAITFGIWAKAPLHTQSHYAEEYEYYEETDSKGNKYVVEEHIEHVYNIRQDKDGKVQRSHHVTRTRYKTDFTCVPKNSGRLERGNLPASNEIRTAKDQLEAARQWLKTADPCLSPRMLEEISEAISQPKDRETFLQEAKSRCASPSCKNPTEVLPEKPKAKEGELPKPETKPNGKPDDKTKPRNKGKSTKSSK